MDATRESVLNWAACKIADDLEMYVLVKGKEEAKLAVERWFASLEEKGVEVTWEFKEATYIFIEKRGERCGELEETRGI